MRQQQSCNPTASCCAYKVAQHSRQQPYLDAALSGAKGDGVRVAHADAGHAPHLPRNFQLLCHDPVALHPHHHRSALQNLQCSGYFKRSEFHTAHRSTTDASKDACAGLNVQLYQQVPCGSCSCAKHGPVTGREGTWVGCKVVGTKGPSRIGSPISTHTCPSSSRFGCISPACRAPIWDTKTPCVQLGCAPAFVR